MSLALVSPFFPGTLPISPLSVVLFVPLPKNWAMHSSFTCSWGSSLAKGPVRRRKERKNKKRNKAAFYFWVPSGTIIIRVTHSCQILVDRNESPWGNPPDALGTLHAQLTCIQFTENGGDFANAWKVYSRDRKKNKFTSLMHYSRHFPSVMPWNKNNHLNCNQRSKTNEVLQRPAEMVTL